MICKHCGNEFEISKHSSNKNQQYCSSKCRRLDNYKSKGRFDTEVFYRTLKDRFHDNLLSTYDEVSRFNSTNMRDLDLTFKCSVCGKPYLFNTFRYHRGYNKCKECSSKDKSKKIKEIVNTKEVQDKRKDTLLNKYGRTNVGQFGSVEHKVSMLEKYGVDNPSMSVTLKQKNVKSRLEKLYHIKLNTDRPFPVQIFKPIGDELKKFNLDPSLPVNLFVPTFNNTVGRKPTLIEFKECYTNIKKGWDILFRYYPEQLDSVVYTYNTSQDEVDLVNYIKSIYGGEVLTNARNVIDPYEVDIYIPEFKLAIEYNGYYWHSYNAGKPRDYHFNKTKLAEDKGIHLIHIWEYEWQDSILQERIKSIIKGELNLTYNKIYARRCNIREIDSKTYRDFIINHSMFGYRGARHKYGLFYQDELVMVFGVGYCQSGRGGIDKTKLEIIRSATKLDTIVVGGTSKMLKHIISDLKGFYPDIRELVYFVDYDKHLGRSVISTGGIFDGYTGPSIRLIPKKDVILTNSKGNTRKLEKGVVYNRMPLFHKEISKYVENNDILALYNSGTKRFHFNIGD